MRNSAAAFVAALALAGAPAAAQTLDDIGAVAPFIDLCVTRQLRSEGFAGRHDVTLRLAFRRDGSIIGEPNVTYSRPPRGELEQERFIALMIRSFRVCAPLPFSKGLGGAIAGKIFTFRYTLTDAKDQSI